jgi:hypothetical protein
MPEIDVNEHPNGLDSAPPPRGTAVATPAFGHISLSTTGASTASGPRTAGSDARSAHGARQGSPDRPRGRMSASLQYLDVALVLVAAPVAIALGAPVFGCLVGAIGWLVQRILAGADKRWVGRAAEPRTRLGLSLFEAFGRIWLLAGAIILAGVAGGHPDGLTAALVIFAAYSVAFATRVFSGRPAPPGQREVAR